MTETISRNVKLVLRNGHNEHVMLSQTTEVLRVADGAVRAHATQRRAPSRTRRQGGPWPEHICLAHMNVIGPLLGRHAPPFAHYNCLAVSRGVRTAHTAHLFFCSPHMSCRSSRTFYSRFYAPCERVPAAATHRAARLNRQDPCRSSCATRPMHTSGPMRTRSARAQMPRRARERKTTPTRATIPGTCAASSWSPCPSGYASTPQLTQRPSLARGAARC